MSYAAISILVRMTINLAYPVKGDSGYIARTSQAFKEVAALQSTAANFHGCKPTHIPKKTYKS